MGVGASVSVSGDLRLPTHGDLPRVMGILNVTPDSFSDGGQHASAGRALEHAHRLASEGADLIDVGGESTRPGADPVSVDLELARVVPVIEAIGRELDIPVSVDTSRPEVMRAAVAAGACVINDVRALRLPGALEAATDLGVPVCLAHMAGTSPRAMQGRAAYGDVVAEVRDFLTERVAACREAGLSAQVVLIDPGFGFGKTPDHNLTLLARLESLVATGFPVLVGLSRKSVVGALLGRPVERRLAASLALALEAARRGAAVLRVHDVDEAVDALRISRLVENAARR
jgi:dihydropteroate synthase